MTLLPINSYLNLKIIQNLMNSIRSETLKIWGSICGLARNIEPTKYSSQIRFVHYHIPETGNSLVDDCIYCSQFELKKNIEL
jgi:hypothetical protein